MCCFVDEMSSLCYRVRVCLFVVELESVSATVSFTIPVLSVSSLTLLINKKAVVYLEI